MLAMFVYGIGIMYSPGPVNLLSTSLGFNKKIKESLGFFLGIAFSMVVYILVLGITGEKIIRKEYLIYLSTIGSCYIIYLAVKIWNSKIKIDNNSKKNTLKFQDGFIIQSLNPKGILATVPICTIYFPSNNITGIKIVLMSIILGIIAFFAPFIYSLLGKFLGELIKNKNFFLVFNKIMAIFLVIISILILKDHVYLVLIGVNPY